MAKEFHYITHRRRVCPFALSKRQLLPMPRLHHTENDRIELPNPPPAWPEARLSCDGLNVQHGICAWIEPVAGGLPLIAEKSIAAPAFADAGRIHVPICWQADGAVQDRPSADVCNFSKRFGLFSTAVDK